MPTSSDQALSPPSVVRLDRDAVCDGVLDPIDDTIREIPDKGMYGVSYRSPPVVLPAKERHPGENRGRNPEALLASHVLFPRRFLDSRLRRNDGEGGHFHSSDKEIGLVSAFTYPCQPGGPEYAGLHPGR